MGMTIDDSIKILQSRKEEALENGYKGFSNALSNAIDTMRKYQQIEEIYKNWCYPTHINAVEAMNKLGEVLKDEID